MKTLIISLASLGTIMGMSTNFLAATKIAQPLRQSESLLTSAHATSKMKVYWDEKIAGHHKDLTFDANFDGPDKETGYKFFYHEVALPNSSLFFPMSWKPLNDNATAKTTARWYWSGNPAEYYTGTPFDDRTLDPSNFTKFQMTDLIIHTGGINPGGLWLPDSRKILKFSDIEMQSAFYRAISWDGPAFATLQQVIGISIFNRYFSETHKLIWMVAIFGFQKWENWYGNSHLNLGTGIEIEYKGD